MKDKTNTNNKNVLPSIQGSNNSLKCGEVCLVVLGSFFKFLLSFLGAMDLQSLQYQMWLAVRRHQALIGRRQEDPHNLAVQKEILDVLCQLVSINESQKLVVARLREERQHQRLKQEKENGLHSDEGRDDIDLLCDEQMLHEVPDHETKTSTSDKAVTRPPESLGDQETPPAPENTDQGQPVVADGCKDQATAGVPDAPVSPSGWWCSPEKRLHNFQPPTADYSQEDIHDLVTEDEFMHALGLLTVREWEEVLAKRYERRKHTAYSHIFSATIWEKPETRRKRRAWLTSGAGSPPMLRRKVRPPSQPPSQPQSRPVSPTQSSCSPMTTCPLSQPASPQSLEEDYPAASQPSEEICPMCKVKGADVQCDGCGVVYHGQCVDLEDSEPPPFWLCLTCEQLGLRASTHSDPHHLSRRREALAVRERLLRQRAELTIAKLQLEEKKHHLSLALQAQCAERARLQQKEDEVRKAILQLQNFISTFQKPPPSQPSSPLPPPPPPCTTPSLTTHSVQSSPVSSPCTSSSSSPPHSLFPGIIISQSSSSPSPSSLSPHSQATAVSLPNRTLSHSTSPSYLSSPCMTPSVTISRSSSPRQAAPQSFMSGNISQPSSPRQRASHTHSHGMTVSASPSPKQNYHNEKQGVEYKSQNQAHQKRVKLPPSHPRRDASLHSLLPTDDLDSSIEPTDLSFTRQSGLTGIRRGKNEAMAASS